MLNILKKLGMCSICFMFPLSLMAGALDKLEMNKGDPLSIQAQKKLNVQFYNLLKKDKFDEFNSLVNSIPDCSRVVIPDCSNPAAASATASATRCFDRTGEPVSWDSSFKRILSDPLLDKTVDNREEGVYLRFPRVSYDKAFYWALTKIYMDVYKEDPATSFINENHYREFYERFKNAGPWNTPEILRGAGVPPDVEYVMIQGWNNGDMLKGWSNGLRNICGTGWWRDVRSLLRTIQAASILNSTEKDEYLWATEEVFSKWKGSEFNPLLPQREIHRLVTEMNALIRKNPKYLPWKNQITEYWMERLLSEGDLLMLSRASVWVDLAVKPNEKRRKLAQEMYQINCGKKANGECAAFRNYARLYGYMQPTQEELPNDVKKGLRHPRSVNGHILPMR